MILSVLALTPRLGRAGDVVEFFERERIVENALTVDGCRGVELWEGEGQILALATWDSADAYQMWLDHPARRAAAATLEELLASPISGERRGGRYELVLAGGNPNVSASTRT